MPSLPLRQVSHLSRVVEDLRRSVKFHTEVMGFQEIKRPDELPCEGAWCEVYLPTARCLFLVYKHVFARDNYGGWCVWP